MTSQQVTGVILKWFLMFSVLSCCWAQFQPAPTGCAMAHCDPSMSDVVRLWPPRDPAVTVVARDTAAAGSGKGLGCSSNGTVAVCAYKATDGNTVIAYDAAGARLWTSGTLLNSTAQYSVPVVNAAGEVIAADDQRLIRFTADGEVAWSVAHAGGAPISPVLAGGTIILATAGGPVSAYDSTDGRLLSALTVTAQAGDAYETTNTPCVAGTRLYVSMHKRTAPGYGALVAIDIGPPLRVAWTYGFGGPSGASPLCTASGVHFDTAGPSPGVAAPQAVGLRDDGASYTVLYSATTPAATLASFAADPRRDGYWVMPYRYRYVQKRSFSGEVIDSLDIPVLVGDSEFPNLPMSAITMAGTDTDPVMLIGTTHIDRGSAYVVAIDLNTRARLWRVRITDYAPDRMFSQFPIVIAADGRRRVVCPGTNSGAFFLGVQ